MQITTLAAMWQCRKQKIDRGTDRIALDEKV